MKATYNFIFSEAGIAVSENMLLQWEDMGNNENKNNYGSTKRKTVKQGNIKQQQAFVHSEGQHYESGAFRRNSSK